MMFDSTLVPSDPNNAIGADGLLIQFENQSAS